MSLRITVLGCGSSGGVPRVALGWGACDPNEPKNRRRRCSILVERIGPGGVTRLLVDTSPDLRDQLVGLDIKHLDGVLMTHDHADHTHGIDDLRGFAIAARRRVDLWCDAPTSAVLRARFGYCFETPAGSAYPPILTEHRIEDGRPTVVNGAGGPIEALPFRLPHGPPVEALGFRFGDFAYTPDLSGIPPSAEAALAGLDLWLVDALRYAPHPSHLSLAQALEAIARFQPRRAVVTNLHSDLDYATLLKELPDGVTPAYDGMVLETPAPGVRVP
jgi:phosphoribosyl 1,2-cyclic phosphate phosphodiesterase